MTAMPNRRQVIRSLAGSSLLMPGLLSWMLGEGATPSRASETPSPGLDPLAPHPAHFSGKAKRVIMLHMSVYNNVLCKRRSPSNLWKEGGG